MFAEPIIDRQLRNAERVEHGKDASLFVEFYMRAVKHNAESERQGRPIFVEKEYVKILAPGDRNSEVDRPAKEEDKLRFPQQYANFKNKNETPVVGTPLEQWPRLSVAQVAELKAMKVFTVEMIANASDSQIQKLGMGALELRREAQAYLAAAKDSAVPQHLAAELERANADNARLQQQLSEMAEQIRALQEKRGPGRPRKDAE